MSLICAQSFDYPPETFNKQLDFKKEVRKSSREHWKLLSNQLKPDLPSELLYSTELAAEKGASNWLTALPIQEHGFTLHKAAFRDALALRYGWRPNNLPSECVCGKPLSVDHSLSCSRGGLPTLRHNELRDLTASLLSEVCTNVAIEPPLQEFSGEELLGATANRDSGARLDIVADGFWGTSRERSYFDVRVFNPYATSNRQSSLSSTYRSHEKEKKRLYLQRIRDVEHSSFSPLVFSSTGGMAKEASIFYKRMASLLSEKHGQTYSTTMAWLRCVLSFFPPENHLSYASEDIDQLLEDLQKQHHFCLSMLLELRVHGLL